MITFLHPVIMIAVVLTTFYTAYLGVQTRRTRTSQGEERKELVKQKFNLKHTQAASILLSAWVISAVGGMAATYYLYGKLFFSPHLIMGLSLLCLAALAGSLSIFIHQGKDLIRLPHILLGTLIVILSIAQAFSGVNILFQHMIPELFG